MYSISGYFEKRVRYSLVTMFGLLAFGQAIDTHAIPIGEHEDNDYGGGYVVGYESTSTYYDTQSDTSVDVGYIQLGVSDFYNDGCDGNNCPSMYRYKEETIKHYPSGNYRVTVTWKYISNYSIDEPSTLALLSLGLVMLGIARHKKKE